MATYLELRALFSHNELKNRIEVACIIAAETIRNEDGAVPNHANRLIWAKAVFSNPQSVSGQMLMALLAANENQDVETITDVDDAGLQTLVNEAVDMFADGS